MIKVSDRSAVEPFRVMEVLKRAFEMDAEPGKPGVCHLEVGQPGGKAPRAVLDDAVRVLAESGIGYTNALGIPELRKAIANHYCVSYGLEIDSSRILVTAGSSVGFILSFLAAFDQGDSVALVEPAYPAYRNILSALGLKPIMIPGRPEDRFLPTPELLADWLDEIDGLVVTYPNNPTGAMLSQPEMAALAAFCDRQGIRLISDEIYHGITYERPALTALDQPSANDIIVINSFSKYFCMTGWRLGWMVVPESLVTPVERLAQRSVHICPYRVAVGGGEGI